MDVLAVALFPYIVHYVRKSVVFLCSCFLGQVHVRIRGRSVMGEWDSVAARGMWWWRIMAGGVSKACQ